MNFFSKWRAFAKFDFDGARYQSPIGGTPLTQRMYRVLHGHDPDDILTRYIDRSVAGLVLLSVTLNFFLNIESSDKSLQSLVILLDFFATLALTIEIILKCVIVDLDPRLAGLKFQRLRFMVRPMSLLDVVILIPSWLSIFLSWHILFLQLIRIIRLAELVHPVMATINNFKRETHGYTFRRRTYSAFFGGERDHGIPGVVDFMIFAVIMLSILLMTLESVDWMRKIYMPKFHALDMIVTAVFIFEYICRVYCCVEEKRYQWPVWGRIRYMLTASALVDFVAIAPFFIGLVWDTPVPWLWALRLFRMLKLGRYSTSVATIMSVVREERAVLSAAIMMLFLLTMFAASGIYVSENAAQPEKFSSIPVSMYWAVVTLTSIGYGDYYPITPIGKLLTMVLAIAGLGMIALPAGILANGFSQKIKTNHKPRHRDSAGQFVRENNHGMTEELAQANSDTISDQALSQKFASMDQVLRSDEACRKLGHLIEPLNRAEREALIAITALSLNNKSPT